MGIGKKEVARGLDIVWEKKNKGFTMSSYNGDTEFEIIRRIVSPITLQICGTH